MSTFTFFRSWENIKSLITSKSLLLQYEEKNDLYNVFLIEGNILYYTEIFKTNHFLNSEQSEQDLNDFETNFKLTANKPLVLTDSEGAPLSRSRSFANSDGFRFRGKGISGIATHGQVTNIDYKLTEERYINGVDLIVKNQTIGDSLKFQVVDKDYAYAGVLYPANYNGIAWSVVAPTGVVLDEFGTDWYLSDDSQKQGQILIPYPARILVNLYVRLVYTSLGSTDVNVYANLFLHKKS